MFAFKQLFLIFNYILRRRNIFLNKRMVFFIDNVKLYLNRFDNILENMVSEMEASIITGSITKDFIRTMIPHHKAAILMSKNLLNYSNYQELMEIARNIIKVQEEEIKEMEKIYKSSNLINGIIEIRNYIENYTSIFHTMIYKMKNSKRTCNINLDFTYEMIPHHEGAILMCKNLLNYQINPDLKSLALKIIELQSEGITKLQLIRKNLLNEK